MKDNEVKKLESEIHHEFQLDRVILFSDAVFAIAITLMVLELKLPHIDKTESADEIWNSLSPLIKNFIALSVSFFFIGLYWYKHLKLCGLLVDFNRTFISLNLLFLFFIVLFPFSVSSMMNFSVDFFPVAPVIYFANIFFTTLTHFILYLYLLGKGKDICKPVSETEKKILREQSLFPIVMISLLFVAIFISITKFQDNPGALTIVYVIVAALLVTVRRIFSARHKKMREELNKFDLETVSIETR